jgi:hypothetical protein
MLAFLEDFILEVYDRTQKVKNVQGLLRNYFLQWNIKVPKTSLNQYLIKNYFKMKLFPAFGSV